MWGGWLWDPTQNLRLARQSFGTELYRTPSVNMPTLFTSPGERTTMGVDYRCACMLAYKNNHYNNNNNISYNIELLIIIHKEMMCVITVGATMPFTETQGAQSCQDCKLQRLKATRAWCCKVCRGPCGPVVGWGLVLTQRGQLVASTRPGLRER